jgi:hypothetical protein
VGPGPRVRDWAVGFDGGEEAHYRRRWCAPHATVRLLHPPHLLRSSLLHPPAAIRCIHDSSHQLCNPTTGLPHAHRRDGPASPRRTSPPQHLPRPRMRPRIGANAVVPRQACCLPRWNRVRYRPSPCVSLNLDTELEPEAPSVPVTPRSTCVLV